MFDADPIEKGIIILPPLVFTVQFHPKTSYFIGQACKFTDTLERFSLGDSVPREMVRRSSRSS